METFIVAIPYIDKSDRIRVHVETAEARNGRDAVVLVLKRTPGMRMHGVANVAQAKGAVEIVGGSEVPRSALEGWT